MSEARSYLFDGEEVSLIVRPHPVVLAKHLLPPLAGVALLAAYTNRVTLAIFLVVLVRFGWDVGLWWVDRYVLTTARILSLSGLITKTIVSMPLQRITDLRYSRSIPGRILGYGTLELETAGENGLDRISFLPDPDYFYRAIMSLSLGPRPHGRPPENPGKPPESEAPGAHGAHGAAPSSTRSTSDIDHDPRIDSAQTAQKEPEGIDLREAQEAQSQGSRYEEDTSEIPIVRHDGT